MVAGFFRGIARHLGKAAAYAPGGGSLRPLSRLSVGGRAMGHPENTARIEVEYPCRNWRMKKKLWMMALPGTLSHLVLAQADSPAGRYSGSGMPTISRAASESSGVVSPARFNVPYGESVAAALVSDPTNQTIAAGSTVTLTAQVTGGPNDFLWFHNGIPLPDASYLPGARTSSLQVVGATPADAGKYQLKWTNPRSGAGQTAVAILTVTGNYVRWSGSGDIEADPINAPLPTPGEIVTNASSFTLKASGFGAFDSATAVGDNGYFRYETVVGDFDKKVRLLSLAMNPESERAEPFARGSLLVRESTNANTPTLEIAAANPLGANLVRVIGRGRLDQVYARRLSRDYPGVSENLTNQWLRIQRVGNSFSFYVGTNGTTWSLISQQYQVFSNAILVGAFAAVDDTNVGAAMVEAEFAEYGDVIVADTVAPALVSAGTTDKKRVGLKFSKPLNSISATTLKNYALSQGTIVGARLGIGGDAVYLEVTGLTNDTFTVTATGVVDTAGNSIPPGSTASGKKANWTMTDIGYIQDPTSRPTPGDDPYVVGEAVALSSDSNPEFEIIGGGSNAYNPGDFMDYLYRPYPGDFDVAVAVNRFDRRGIAGGYGNGGIHVRAGLYRTDNTDIGENTKVPAYVNTVYYEGSDPNRAAIELHRANVGENYGNNVPNLNTNLISGIEGFFTGLRAVNAAGVLSDKSSATQAHWLRVRRVGTTFTSLFSYDGVTWVEQDGAGLDLPKLAGTVLVGFGSQNDTGFGVPPENTYPGNGTVDADGKPSQNESNYGVLRISHFGDFLDTTSPKINIHIETTNLVITYTGTLQSANRLDGGFSNVVGISPLVIPLASPSGATFYRAHR